MFQRVKAIFELLKVATAEISNDNNILEKQDNNTQYSDLPPKVQEKIMNEIKDSQTLLTLRLVNNLWNQMASSLLEQRHLSNWTRWYPSPCSKVPTLAPSIVQVFRNKNRELTHLSIPEALELQLSSCPFPAKSISIFGDPCFLYNRPKVEYTSTMEWNNFWVVFGSYLSTLILYGVELTPPQFIGMLAHTPNLKALTMCHVRSVGKCEVKHSEIILSSSLQYLQLFHENNELSDLILDVCAHQIISLTLVCISVSVLCGRNFGNLKQLKIFGYAGHQFKQIRAADIPQNLEYLSIISNKVNKSYAGQFHIVLNFVSRLSSSLIHLHLNIPSEHLAEYFWKKKIVYSKLSSLSIQEIGVRTHTFQFRNESFRKEDSLFCVVFPKLQCINFKSPIGQVEL